jgi:P-type Cu+ transporter
LIKGGKYLELLGTVDVLLVDQTGTLTLDRPKIEEVIPLVDLTSTELLRLAASAEHYSEHPLAEAVRAAARRQNLELIEPEHFTSIPGIGVVAALGGQTVMVGSGRMVAAEQAQTIESRLLSEGKTLLWVSRDGQPVGILAASDSLRDEVPQAFQRLRKLGIRRIELLSSGNEHTAAALAEPLGIHYRANLLPEDRIAIVKEYQAKGRRVALVGDGVSDAPALAQADVGIAMGSGGAHVAVEAAHIALLQDDWLLVPQVFAVARRTMRVVKGNIAFSAVFNVVGMTLAGLGYIPLILAAVAQLIPGISILFNSSRLLKQ